MHTKEKSNIYSKLIKLCSEYFKYDNYSKDYLVKTRGLSLDICNTYSICSFPDDIEYIKSHIPTIDLIYSGIIKTKEDKELCILSYNNIIIPIFNIWGEPIAINSRSSKYDQSYLDSLDIPKYWHTFFKKSNCLYGMNVAYEEIIKKNCVYIVEGNLDVLSAHALGIKNVVGLGSTTLTNAQFLQCSRLAENIVLMLDNDEAGLKGMNKIYKKYKDFINIEAKIITGAKDFNDLLLKGNKWQEQISSINLEKS